MAKPKNDLSKIQVDFQSFCAAGKNHRTEVVLYKSRDPEATQEELLAKALEDPRVVEAAKAKSLDVNDSSLTAGLISKSSTFTREQFVGTLLAKLKSIPAPPANEGANMEKPEIEKAELEKKIAELTKSNARLEKLAMLSDDAKAYVSKLASDEEKDSFFAKPKDEQDKEVAKAIEIQKAADETITVAGIPISKSKVGAEQFAIFKAQQAQIDQQAVDLAKAKEDATMARLEKRAEKEFPHTPGTALEKAQALLALEALPADVRKTLEATMVANERLAKAAFETLGSSAGGDVTEDVAKAASGFMAKADEIEKRDGCTKAEALSKARREDPKGYEAFQQAN